MVAFRVHYYGLVCVEEGFKNLKFSNIYQLEAISLLTNRQYSEV